MKFRNLHLAYSVVALLCLLTLTSNSLGKPGASSSGCGGGSCHTSNAATSILISIDGNSNVTTYTPGKKYAIVVTVSNSSFSGNMNAKAGLSLNFSKGNITSSIPNITLTGQELNHTSPRALSSGSTAYSFDWTAPGAGSGAVNINIAANIVNGDLGSSGDAWTTTSKSLTEEVSSTAKKPSIASITSSAITNTGATINAQINANSSNTMAEVQFGTSTTYGGVKSMTPNNITGSIATAASASLTGLLANTTYNYRIKATNSLGDSFSTNSTFKTNATGSAIVQSDITQIAVYPNPASNYTIVKGKHMEKDCEISIINTSGKRLSLPIISTSADEIKLNTSALSKGQYYIQWNDNGNRKSFPLVIEH